MDTKKKIGVYGGTFNPVHRGHEFAAMQFYRLYALDELLIIPVFVPPHKQADGIPAEYRLKMCRLAFGGEKFKAQNMNVTVSDIEITGGEISYTFNTLAKLKRAYGEDCKFLFLIGTDMFFSLDKWYRYEELFGLCTFVAAKRSESDMTAEADEKLRALRDSFIKTYGAEIDIADMGFLDISSTRLRDMIRNGGDVSDYISPDVMRFIEENGLYR